MLEWHTGELAINGVRLHYRRTFGGGPPLVLVHGLTDSALYWAPVLERLGQGYDLVIYDARGHGRSEKPAAGYTYDQLADDLAALIGALGLDRPVVIGHSMGAATTALAAARYPALMRAIVLEDPPAGADVSPALLRAVYADWLADLQAKQALTRAERVARVRAEQPQWSAADYELWADDKALVSPDALEIIHTPGTLWFDLIEQVACPILLITGDPALGALLTPEFAAGLAARWRNGSVAHIGGVGHAIRRSSPEAYIAAVREFLARV